jgi:CO/xanthine dehydrogenase FAD-binding subunit
MHTNNYPVPWMRYARPQTLPDALALLAGGKARVLAGGTDLYPATQAQDLAGPVLDLTAIPHLSGITRSDDGALCIGAATTWTDIAETALPPALHALQQAARQVGGRQIQNAGTIGGNLCNASPAADGIPPLLALDAQVDLASPSATRRLPLSAFLLGPRRTALGPDELLAAIHVPAHALTGTSRFLKLGARAHLVISIVMVAARLTLNGNRIATARLAVGACSPVAIRLPALESRLVDLTLPEAAANITPDSLSPALSPIDDIRATADYRHEAAAELLRRAVQECAP